MHTVDLTESEQGLNLSTKTVDRGKHSRSGAPAAKECAQPFCGFLARSYKQLLLVFELERGIVDVGAIDQNRSAAWDRQDNHGVAACHDPRGDPSNRILHLCIPYRLRRNLTL